MANPATLAHVEDTNSEPSTSLALLRPVASPEAILEAHKEGVALIAKVLDKETDYGVIPGTGDKPTLLKPGAERLLTAFGCYADAEIVEQEVDHDRLVTFTLRKWETAKEKPSDETVAERKAAGTGRWRKGANGWQWQEAIIEDGESQGLYRYVIKTNIIQRESGRIIASGVGACTTMETKYIRSPRDYENTVLKMAKKRAMIDAVLNAFGLSDRFTQDVEEMAQFADAPSPAPESQQKPALPGGEFIKKIGLSAEQFATFRDACISLGYSWPAVAKEAEAAGVKNGDELTAYLRKQVDGEGDTAAAVGEPGGYDPFQDE
jgi:hypothetical protein